MNNTFPKHEKLKSKKYFDALFDHGNSFKSYPVRAVFLEFLPENFPASTHLPNCSQLAFAVPKKRFKHAVDRNRIKRQLRECYRLNKTILTGNFAVVLVYLGQQHLDANTLERAVIEILEQIQKSSTD